MMCAEPPRGSGVISVYRSRVGIPVHGSLTVNCSPPDFLHCMYTRVRTHLRETLVINSNTYIIRDILQSMVDLEI